MEVRLLKEYADSGEGDGVTKRTDSLQSPKVLIHPPRASLLQPKGAYKSPQASVDRTAFTGDSISAPIRLSEGYYKSS